jgi:hypothetical protein
MSALEEEILERLKALRPEEREQVLEYARSLGDSPRKGVPGTVLRPFFGIWSEEEAEEIQRAINEACERVDPSDG